MRIESKAHAVFCLRFLFLTITKTSRCTSSILFLKSNKEIAPQMKWTNITQSSFFSQHIPHSIEPHFESVIVFLHLYWTSYLIQHLSLLIQGYLSWRTKVCFFSKSLKSKQWLNIKAWIKLILYRLIPVCRGRSLYDVCYTMRKNTWKWKLDEEFMAFIPEWKPDIIFF